MHGRLAGTLLSAALLPFSAGAADCGSLEGLRWLLGEWVADGSQSSFHESWRELGPDDFQGTGVERSEAAGTVGSMEDLRLLRMGQGVFYVSKVSHNELPVAFRLNRCTDGVFVFENGAHDFPKRLEYRRKGEAGFVVRVSDGGDRGYALEFRRAASNSTDGGSLLAAEDARFRAMIAADRQGMERWFDEDLEYVHSTGVVEGRDRLINAIAGGRTRYLAVEPVERQVTILARGVALVHGIGRFRVSAGAEPMDLLLQYTAVYLERGGDWRLRSWQSLRIAEKRSES
jgi:hypothetical protein